MMRGRKNKTPVFTMTEEEKRRYMQQVEEENPGYLAENAKLKALVWILTGVRVLYALFYLFVSYVYQLGMAEGIVNLVGCLFFFGWYTLMLRSGKLVAVVMLLFRGYGIVTNGAAILSVSPWLPFSLIFTLVVSVIMQFAEAVFCIYVLFDARARQTVRLNCRMELSAISQGVSKDTLEKMAEYKNPYAEGGETEPDFKEKTEEKTTENSQKEQ